MAEQSDGENNSEDNPVMDYPEHERTYTMFVAGSKWLTIIVAALLIAMAFGFFAGGGWLGGLFVFFALMIIAWFFG